MLTSILKSVGRNQLRASSLALDIFGSRSGLHFVRRPFSQAEGSAISEPTLSPEEMKAAQERKAKLKTDAVAHAEAKKKAEAGGKAQVATDDGAVASEEELERARLEWGLKYTDEAFKFEKEWKEIADRVEKEQRVYLESELGDLQKRKVDMLADKVLSLNIFEIRYFAASISDKLQKSSGIHPMKINLDWPSLKQDAKGTWPPANPNWFRQQELMSQLGPFMGAMGGGAPAAAQSTGEAAPKEEKKEEVKQEKSHYDLELTGFDAAKKVVLIKELRQILGTGLKETKDMVEQAPTWIKKEVKKEEAEALVEKIKGFGGEVRMA